MEQCPIDVRSVLEVLNKRGLLHTQMLSVSTHQHLWNMSTTPYLYEILVIYRTIVIYAFMQFYGIWNTVDVYTGASPYHLPLYLVDEIVNRYTTWTFDEWQSVIRSLEDDREYQNQTEYIQRYIGVENVAQYMSPYLDSDIGRHRAT
jgi:hypothetical protein